MEGCTFSPQGRGRLKKKNDVLSSSFASRVCEMGPLFVRVFVSLQGDTCDLSKQLHVICANAQSCSVGPAPPQFTQIKKPSVSNSII